MADDDGDRSLGIEDGFNEFGDIIGVDQTRLFGDEWARTAAYSARCRSGWSWRTGLRTRWGPHPLARGL